MLEPSAPIVLISPRRRSFQEMKTIRAPSRDQAGKSWKSPSGAVSWRGVPPATSET
jgi:hypothetical protein